MSLRQQLRPPVVEGGDLTVDAGQLPLNVGVVNQATTVEIDYPLAVLPLPGYLRVELGQFVLDRAAFGQLRFQPGLKLQDYGSRILDKAF
ncbi:MAG: hypothetical protein Q8P31_11500 [Bacillota bacterium]|nr:hypothetical protein [Bacillota bacterium]